MACFLVPATEAVIASVVKKNIKNSEKKVGDKDDRSEENFVKKENKIPFSAKLKWLTSMLWGGTALLAFEHLWHGEITPWFPFLTAAQDPGSRSEMLFEMATTGVTMAILITAAWCVMLLGAKVIENRVLEKSPAKK